MDEEERSRLQIPQEPGHFWILPREPDKTVTEAEGSRWHFRINLLQRSSPNISSAPAVASPAFSERLQALFFSLTIIKTRASNIHTGVIDRSRRSSLPKKNYPLSSRNDDRLPSFTSSNIPNPVFTGRKSSRVEVGQKATGNGCADDHRSGT